MQRYFFDLMEQASVRYDYQGREFMHSDEARKQAELIALDFGCTRRDDPNGGEIQVRNIGGQHLFSVPIPQLERIAA